MIFPLWWSVFFYRYCSFIRLKDGLVIIDVLDQDEHGLSDELTISKPVVRQSQDNTVLIFYLKM